MTHEELAFKLVKTKCFHDYTTGAHCAACATEAIRRHADLMLDSSQERVKELERDRDFWMAQAGDVLAKATAENDALRVANLQVGELIDGIRSAFLAIDRVHPVDDDQMSRLCHVTEILHDALRKSGVTKKRHGLAPSVRCSVWHPEANFPKDWYCELEEGHSTDHQKTNSLGDVITWKRT